MVFVFRKKNSRAKDQQLQSLPYDSLLGSDQPQDLWDRAHKLLREDESKKQLLVAYEKILLSEFDNDVLPIASVDWGSRDRTRQVSRLMEEKLKALKESSWRLQLIFVVACVLVVIDERGSNGDWLRPVVSINRIRTPIRTNRICDCWSLKSLLSPLLFRLSFHQPLNISWGTPEISLPYSMYSLLPFYVTKITGRTLLNNEEDVKSIMKRT